MRMAKINKLIPWHVGFETSTINLQSRLIFYLGKKTPTKFNSQIGSPWKKLRSQLCQSWFNRNGANSIRKVKMSAFMNTMNARMTKVAISLSKVLKKWLWLNKEWLLTLCTLSKINKRATLGWHKSDQSEKELLLCQQFSRYWCGSIKVDPRLCAESKQLLKTFHLRFCWELLESAVIMKFLRLSATRLKTWLKNSLRT